jgi:hypothetical protein
MIRQFCAEHLNDEYADLCCSLAQRLARKRPSPLVKGKPNSWACGIVRAIGHVNFLDDPSQQPHLKSSQIDEAFGVSESTAKSKSLAIRKMFNMGPLDPHWTLTSHLDDNPLVWMVQVNGFVVDIRHCPREAQEAAFAKGLIPYIPADRA